MKKELIYIIEDDEFFGFVVESYIQKQLQKNAELISEYEIRVFKDPESCIKALDKEPSILISDFELNAKMNGIDLVKTAQKKLPNSSCYVMSADWNNKEACEKKGINKFILKDDTSLNQIENIMRKETTFLMNHEFVNDGNNKTILLVGTAALIGVAFIEIILSLFIR